jgi:hypothetical protein
MSTQLKLLPAIAAIGIVCQSAPAYSQGYNNGAGFPQGNGGYQPYTPPPPENYAGSNYGNVPTPVQGVPMQGRVCYVPAGLTMRVTLSTSISTDVAKSGDLVEATVADPIQLSDGVIPAGARVEGNITNAKAGGFLGRAGMMTVQFNRLVLPNGQQIPMATHINGDLGKYKQKGNGTDTVAGEGAGTKVAQTVGRGVVGAGVGAALGTAVGAIAGAGMHRPWWYGGGSYAGRGAGRGAWSGAAIGGGLGVADGLLVRKGKNVEIPAGTSMQLQLDAPMQLATYQQTGQF